MGKRKIRPEPVDSEAVDFPQPDTKNGPDPAFGLRGGLAGTGGYGRGAVCAKCGSSYCDCDWRGGDDEGAY